MSDMTTDFIDLTDVSSSPIVVNLCSPRETSLDKQLHRPCDGMSCIYKDCAENETRTIRPDVEKAIGLTVPFAMLQKCTEKQKKAFLLQWNERCQGDHKNKGYNSVNFIHQSCWEIVCMEETKTSKKEVNIINEVAATMEKYDDIATIIEKIKRWVLPLLLASSSTVAFTGAGLSVSAGLYTYRGAGGIDTLEDFAAKEENEPLVIRGEPLREEEEEEPDWANLQPTLAHYSLAKMNDLGMLQYIATQNCDNLHQKAGIDQRYISDLHGNLFVEVCEKCSTQYTREYVTESSHIESIEEDRCYVQCSECGWNHHTGRKCCQQSCRGKLKDTIVNFGDDLHTHVCGGLTRAKEKFRRSDVSLCLGTSLSVQPSCSLPLRSKNMIIVNLQDTELDRQCDVRLYATTDDFFRILMPLLEEAKCHSNKENNNESVLGGAENKKTCVMDGGGRRKRKRSNREAQL